MTAPAPTNPADALLGRVAVAAKLITMEQLAHATREQGRIGNSKNLGQVLVAMGFLSEANLAKAVELQRGVIARAKEKRTEAPAPAAAEVGTDSDGRAAEALARQARPAPKPTAPLAKPAAQPVERPTAAKARPTPSLASAGGVGKVALDRGLDALLVDASSQGASDIHLHSGSNVRLRIRTALAEVPDAKLTAQLAEKLILPALSSEERAALEQHGEIDF